MGTLSRALGTLGLAIGFASATLAGCFSEREATAPTEGVCRFPLEEGIPGSTVVIIRGFAFGPTEVRIRVGDRVTWVNCEDAESHTSTADGGQWASPLLPPGAAFTQAFAAAGEFPYHCEPHPFMTARVIVE